MSNKDKAALKLGLDPEKSSIKDVRAAMLGLSPKESSCLDVENLTEKLSPIGKYIVETLSVDDGSLSALNKEISQLQ